jgi:colanic acid biosynthesis glycosyl transferase WcaI
VLVGEGVVKAAIADRARELGLKNMTFLPFQPRNILSQVQSTADISVVTLLKGKGMTSVPSKVLGYMAAARAVVASVDHDSDTRRLIDEAGCGICVSPENAELLTEAIMSMYLDRESAALLGRRGREYLVSHCDRKAVISLYERLFLDCCKEKK